MGAQIASWAAVRAHFQCRGCGLFSPLNSLDVDGEVDCLRCGMRQAFEPAAWKHALEHAHDVADLGGGPTPEGRCARRDLSIAEKNPYGAIPPGQFVESTVGSDPAAQAGMMQSVVKIAAAPIEPKCLECGAELDEAPAGPGQVQTRCQKCGATALYRLQPKAVEIYPRLAGVVAADHRTDRPDATIVLPASGGAVAIKCPQCTAPLEVKQGEHFMKCGYCGTTSRIASRHLYRMFDAPPEPETWWTVFLGASEKRRVLEEQVEPGIHKLQAPPEAIPKKKVASWKALLIALPVLALLWLVFDVRAWDGSEPLVCGGWDEIHVSAVEAHSEGGPMIVARGYCKVTCSNCELSADRVVDVGDHARVRISGGRIVGRTAAAVVSGHANLINDQGVLQGPIDAREHATVQNYGTMTGPLYTSGFGRATQLSAPPGDEQ